MVQAPIPAKTPAATPAPVAESDGVVTAVVPTEETEPAPIVAKREPVRKPEPAAKPLEIERVIPVKTPFSQALDIMSESVGTTDILDEVEHNTLHTTFKGTSFVLSAGFLTWALRGASLLASVAASLPAWQGFDPLPVLAAKKRKNKDEELDEDQETKADDWQEKRVQRLFNPAE